VAVVARDQAQAIGTIFDQAGHDVCVIGEVTKGAGVRYSREFA